MHRRLFFLWSGLIALAMGIVLLVSPTLAAQLFGVTPSTATDLLFRAMGATIVSTGVLNLLVRLHADSASLRAVLIFNIVSQVLNIAVDLFGVAAGTVAMSSMAPAQVVHLFILVGSWHYLRDLSRESADYEES